MGSLFQLMVGVLLVFLTAAINAPEMIDFFSGTAFAAAVVNVLDCFLDFGRGENDRGTRLIFVSAILLLVMAHFLYAYATS